MMAMPLVVLFGAVSAALDASFRHVCLLALVVVSRLSAFAFSEEASANDFRLALDVAADADPAIGPCIFCHV